MQQQTMRTVADPKCDTCNVGVLGNYISGNFGLEIQIALAEVNFGTKPKL